MVRKRKGSRVDRLIEEDVRKAKPKSKAYTLVDGRGLGITILPSGSKSWRLRFRWMSKHAVHVLGPFPELSLADARERAIAARRLILDGVHPTHHRGRQRELRRQEDERQQTEKAAQAYTVGDCLTDWHTGRKWTRKEYADQIRSFLDSFVVPKIGGLSLASFTPAQLTKWRDELARESTNMCRLTHGKLRAAIMRARDHGKIDKQRALDLLEIRMVQHDPEHRDPLTPQQLAALWRKLDEHPTEPSALAVKLLHLWFTRPGELRAARWADFDLTNTAEIDHMSKPLPVWRVPKEGTKMQTALLVPLSDESLALLEELRKQTGWSEFLFPGRVRKGRKPSSPITKVVWSDFLTRIGHKEFSLHSARATASTLLREQLNQDSELIELQLGHLRRNSVRASYDFASRLPARFEMMKKWSRWIVDRARVADLPAPKKRTA